MPRSRCLAQSSSTEARTPTTESLGGEPDREIRSLNNLQFADWQRAKDNQDNPALP
jgi:hypothetical protein